MSPLQIVLDQLPKLTKDELGNVLQRAKSLVQFASADVPAPDPTPDRKAQANADFMLATISDYCRHHDLDFLGLTKLKASVHYKSFAEKVPDLMTYINKASTQRVEQRSLLWIALDELRTKGRPADVAMSCSFCMTNIHRLPSLIDAALPGYAVAGLLPMVIKRLVITPKET